MKIGVKKKAELKKCCGKGTLFSCGIGLLLALSACAKEDTAPTQAGASVAASQAGGAGGASFAGAT